MQIYAKYLLESENPRSLANDGERELIPRVGSYYTLF